MRNEAIAEVIVLKKCPCCDQDQLDKIKDMYDRADKIAGEIFEYQNRTRDYSREKTRAWAQHKADLLRYIIDLLEGRGGCL